MAMFNSHAQSQRQQVMNSAILEKSSAIYSSQKYDRKPLLEENRGKIVNFFDKTRFEVEVKSPTPSQWNITPNLVQLAIRK